MENLRKVILVTAVLLGMLGMVSTVSAADDYFVYGVHNTGFSYTCAIDGYVIDDETGLLYVGNGNGVCYIYKVSIPSGSDPDTHPSNPYNTGTMATRTFTLVGTHDFDADCGWHGGHHAEFYIDANYIYYGVYNGGIEKWAKNADGTFGTYLGKVTDKNGNPIPSNGDETFAYDADNNVWYTCDRSRNVYSFDADDDTAWQYEFLYPSYAGGHHDGMEFVNGYLWVSDMTSDYIGQWEHTATGWVEVDRFSYSYGKYVEGMGFGPLGHFWMSSTSYDIYEIGGGKLGVALTDIPDQSICVGESFNTFDLDDYAGGATGLTWTYSGASFLTVSIDPVTHVCTVTYPSGWISSETITFTATCPVGNVNSDDATFTVSTCVPEFSTIAIPVASILGLLFFFNYRKRKREQ
jgi:hypothetical protein